MTNPANKTEGRVVGAAPAGAADEASAATAVRDMFSSIAPRYDLLNHVLSMNVDRLWWNRTARAFSDVLSRPHAQVLDLCCGTGDMTFALYRHRKQDSIEVVGADFSHAMLVRAQEKSRDRRIRWVEADALQLPSRRASSTWSRRLLASAILPTTIADWLRSIEC